MSLKKVTKESKWLLKNEKYFSSWVWWDAPVIHAGGRRIGRSRTDWNMRNSRFYHQQIPKPTN